MSGGTASLTGPDLEKGIPESQVESGKPLLGHALGEPVVLLRDKDDLYAVGATCTHYGGPLAEGIQVGCSLRCPWHHARFDVRTGEPSAPALNPIPCYRLERKDGQVRVTGKLSPAPVASTPKLEPKSVVIVGGGAAGQSAATTLRREGYSGPLTILSADDDPPYDRPNLSKDYLAGNAPEDWIPLRPPDFYKDQRIELVTGARVVGLDARRKELKLADGSVRSFDACLLALGGEPRRIELPGAKLEHVVTLRSLKDSRQLIERARIAKTVVILGASFLGMEVAASLRTRGLSVTVVAPDAAPLVAVLGREVGELIRKVHESHGVAFRLGQTLRSIQAKDVTLLNGETIPAELVVMAVGVQPTVGLALTSGIQVQNGVVVDELLQTTSPGVWAAGDIARWPDPHSGQAIRVEHWVVAQRQGETAARNMLGAKEKFRMVPFFWSTHYDLTLAYVGHAEGWDDVQIEGNLEARDASIWYRKGGKKLALATIFRDVESLKTEAQLEAALLS